MCKKALKIMRKCAVVLVMMAVLMAQTAPVFAAPVQALAVDAGDLTHYVGVSMNSLTNSIESQAIESIKATVASDTDVYEEFYEIIETNEQLKTFVSKVTEGKVDASLFGFGFNASIMKKVENTTTVSNNTMSLVYIVRYNGPKVTLQSGKFTSDAKKLIDAGKKDDFKARYGNSYVKSAYLGGVLIISLSVDTHNMTVKTREECKKALGIKAKFLKDGGVSQEEINEAEKILSTMHTTASASSTDGSPVTVEVMTDRSKYSQRVKEFADYYKNTTKYEVLGRRLDALYNLPGSGYSQSDAKKFPVFYDPEQFTTSNISATSDLSDKSKVTLTWQDGCTFEDSFNIYIDSNSLDTPQLIATASANSTSKVVTLPEKAWQDGCIIWAVPVKDSVVGKIVKPAVIDAAYYVSFYEHANYSGLESTFCGEYIEIPDFAKTRVGNDKVTSIKISGPYNVECYKDYFSGTSHSFRFDDANVYDEPIGDNTISSAIIKRISQDEYEGVYIFKNANVSGIWVKMDNSIPKFKHSPIGNDSASSIRIVGPYECTVYEHDNYQGVQHTYRFTDMDMSNEWIGNDRVSSATAQKKLTDEELNGVYIFDWLDYSGNWDKLTSSISTMANTNVGDNKVGSVKVIGNYNYTLWKDQNFTGSSFSSNTDLNNANTTPVGDDQTSSVTVTKGGSSNKAPVLKSIGSRSVAPGDTCQFTISATDVDSPVLYYSASNLPQGATFDSASRTFKWVTNSDQSGTYTVRFTVSDGALTDYEDVKITISKKGEIDPFEAIETETYDSMSGITVDPKDDDYIIVSNNSYTMYSNVDFDDGATKFYACSKRYNKNSETVKIEVRLDSPDGQLVGTLSFSPSSGWKVRSCKVTKITGVHDLYLKYTGEFYMDYIYFE